MKRIALVTLLLVSTLAAAQSAPPVTLQNTEHRTLRSEKIGQTYDLFVSLPENYAASGKSYAVLYVLDGWHFPLMAYFQNNNIYSGRMPPVIMVNIGHGIGVNPMPLRGRDFTPTHLDKNPLSGGAEGSTNMSGGAPAFLEFIERELIPYIDRTYRTVPTNRALLGHSAAGLFALYTLVERPGLFQRIIAASPVAGWDNGMLLAAARQKLKSLPQPVRLDLSAGDEGDLERELLIQTTAFVRVLDELKPANLDYRFTVYTGENHNSVRFASFPPGLYWVYRP